MYPNAFIAPTEEEDLGDGQVEGEDVHFGQSWDWGTVVLSWRHALRGAQNRDDGDNLILHEFAHQLDHEDGVTNGAPLLDDEEAQLDWGACYPASTNNSGAMSNTSAARLSTTTAPPTPQSFSRWSPSVFLNAPHALQKRHPELYGVLQQFYCQDPRRPARCREIETAFWNSLHLRIACCLGLDLPYPGIYKDLHQFGMKVCPGLHCR